MHSDRYVTKQMARVLSGQKIQGSTDYLELNAGAFVCPIRRESDCRNLNFLCGIYRKRAQG